jgi:hypothetical protein
MSPLESKSSLQCQCGQDSTTHEAHARISHTDRGVLCSADSRSCLCHCRSGVRGSSHSSSSSSYSSPASGNHSGPIHNTWITGCKRCGLVGGRRSFIGSSRARPSRRRRRQCCRRDRPACSTEVGGYVPRCGSVANGRAGVEQTEAAQDAQVIGEILATNIYQVSIQTVSSAARRVERTHTDSTFAC